MKQIFKLVVEKGEEISTKIVYATSTRELNKKNEEEKEYKVIASINITNDFISDLKNSLKEGYSANYLSDNQLDYLYELLK